MFVNNDLIQRAFNVLSFHLKIGANFLMFWSICLMP